jgi:hypothetical protein
MNNTFKFIKYNNKELPLLDDNRNTDTNSSMTEPIGYFIKNNKVFLFPNITYNKAVEFYYHLKPSRIILESSDESGTTEIYSYVITGVDRPNKQLSVNLNFTSNITANSTFDILTLDGNFPTIYSDCMGLDGSHLTNILTLNEDISASVKIGDILTLENKSFYLTIPEELVTPLVTAVAVRISLAQGERETAGTLDALLAKQLNNVCSGMQNQAKDSSKKIKTKRGLFLGV